MIGREHYDKNEHDRAEPVLREILAHSGSNFADVHNMLACILHKQGDLPAAERHFERAVEINPRYTEALINLAVTYNDLGKYDAAQRVYGKIHELEAKDGSPDSFAAGKIANMHADLAKAYLDAGCRPQAIEELRKAVELCPSFADLHVKLGTLYRDSGMLDSARDHFGAACTANPRYVPARVLLGATLLALGNPEEAMAEWRAALSIEPTNAKAKMYLRLAEERLNGQGGVGDDGLPGLDIVFEEEEPTLVRDPVSFEHDSAAPRRSGSPGST